MKRFSFLLLSAAIVGSAHADTFTFKPSDQDLGDLDHHYAYSWGISTSSNSTNSPGKNLYNKLNTGGHVITSVTMTFDDIWDWKVETDILYIHLLNGTASGVKSYKDNPNDSVSNGDYFTNSSRTITSSRPVGYTDQILLTTWSDPVGGRDRNFDLVYSFSNYEMGKLQNWILDGGTFGFGFDPECHYYNDGVKVVIKTGARPVSVPETGVTFGLLSLGLTSLAFLRRYLSKR